MLKHLQALSKESFAYTVSNLVTRASSFILLPVYARLFAPADIGVVNLINVTFFFVFTVTLFCLDSAAVVFYWNDSVTNKSKIFSSWFWFVLTVNVFIFIVVLLLATPLSAAILNSPNYSFHFVIVFLTGVFNILPLLYSNYLRIQRKAYLQLRIALVTAVSNILFTVYFLFYLKFGLIGIFYSQLASASLNSIICLYFFRQHLLFKWVDWQLLKKMLAFSIPVIPTTVTFWVSNSISLYAINYFHNQHEVGLYNVASSIASILNIAIAAISQAVLPFALSISKDEKAKEIYSKIFQAYFFVLGFMAFAIGIFGREVLTVVATNKFVGSQLVLILLVFNSMLVGANTIAGIGLNISQKMKSLLAISLICTLVNLVFIATLVPSLGKVGAAISAFAGSICLVVLTIRSAQKFYPIPYNYKSSFLSFVAFLFFCLLFYFSVEESTVLTILLKSVVIVIGAVILFNHTKKSFA